MSTLIWSCFASENEKYILDWAAWDTGMLGVNHALTRKESGERWRRPNNSLSGPPNEKESQNV
jgi:hypothetical protein